MCLPPVTLGDTDHPVETETEAEINEQLLKLKQLKNRNFVWVTREIRRTNLFLVSSQSTLIPKTRGYSLQIIDKKASGTRKYSHSSQLVSHR